MCLRGCYKPKDAFEEISWTENCMSGFRNYFIWKMSSVYLEIVFLPRPWQSRAEPYNGIFLLLLLLLTFVKIEVGPSLFSILYQYDISFPFTGLFLFPRNHKDPFITIISKANLKGKMSLHKCINPVLVKSNIKFQIKWILNQM